MRFSIFGGAMGGPRGRPAVSLDTTAPTLTSAIVSNSTPGRIDLTWSEAMNSTVSANSAFAVSAGHTLTAHTYVDATHSYLTTSTDFVNGEAARTLAYTQPGSNKMQDLAGNLLANFSGTSITNNVSAGGGPVTVVLSASRTTGPAPLSVTFDAISSSSTTSGVDPFTEILYTFQFDKAHVYSPGSWPALSGIAAMSKDQEIGGPLATTVFDQPGTYVVTCTAFDGVGGSNTASVTITVSAQTSWWTGTNVIYVDPAGVYPSAPSGCVTQTTMPANGAANYSNKLVLVAPGTSFGGLDVDKAANCRVTKFGSGAKPIFDSINVSHDGIPTTDVFSDDCSFIDLAVTNHVTAPVSSFRNLFYRLDITGMLELSGAYEYYLQRCSSSLALPFSAQQHVIECTILSSNGSNLLHGHFGNLSAIIGCDIECRGTNPQPEHNVRTYMFYKLFVAHNRLRGKLANGARHSLKMQACGILPSAASALWGYGYTAPDAPFTIESRYAVVQHNLGGSSSDINDYVFQISPENNQVGGPSADPAGSWGGRQSVRDVIYRGNHMIKGVTGGSWNSIYAAGMNIAAFDNVAENTTWDTSEKYESDNIYISPGLAGFTPSKLGPYDITGGTNS